ncbi:MAG: gamma carbonic anhydrase family protein [Leptospiraceae bacterium]|nr:gamma carbonic anhydrase family protein [Leptospiraceae bacterium]MCP5493777.1 gamma carbonic anhydrase family protein [Leptospiraceae bacterium]
MIYEFNGKIPEIDETAFIAPSAEIIGDVKIGKSTSVWFQTLIRGDVNYIRIGDNCNIQDMTLIHVSKDLYPTIIGNNVSIGHKVTLHACTLKDNSFVGIGAIVMDNVEIGEYSFVAAGSLVTPGKKFPSGVLIMGSPAKIVRDITDKDREMIERTARNYSQYKDNYKNPQVFKKISD